MSDSAVRTTNEPISVSSVDQFEEITGSGGVVVVDFYADWCGPCTLLEPTMEAIAAETEATVAKVNIDAHRELAGRFGVQSVPNLVFFSDGEPTKRVVGVRGRDALVSVVESLSD